MRVQTVHSVPHPQKSSLFPCTKPCTNRAPTVPEPCTNKKKRAEWPSFSIQCDAISVINRSRYQLAFLKS